MRHISQIMRYTQTSIILYDSYIRYISFICDQDHWILLGFGFDLIWVNNAEFSPSSWKMTCSNLDNFDKIGQIKTTFSQQLDMTIIKIRPVLISFFKMLFKTGITVIRSMYSCWNIVVIYLFVHSCYFNAILEDENQVQYIITRPFLKLYT